MLQALSDRPEAEKFAAFLDALLAQRSAELEFIVLFGSMARGDWSRGSDYDVLIGLCGEDGKRLLDRPVVARCHDQLMRRAATTQQRRQRREESMHGRRREIRREQVVELVVQWPVPLHDRDVLRDLRQAGVPAVRVAKASTQLRRELGDVGTKDGDDTSG